jgi:peptide/nickel transport system permease protein
MAFAASLAVRLTRSERLRAGLLWMAFSFQAIPTFFFGLILILVFSVWLGWLPSLGRGSPQHLILPAVTLATFELALYLRLLNSAFLQEMSQDYVRTARAKGGGRVRVLLRHVLPNVTASIIVLSTLQIATVIIAESSLSFLGLGVQPPTITWGTMLSEGRDHLATSWWLATFPGIAISLVVLGINLFGDALAEAFDPRSR